ncbi:MAG: hypothetical protein ACK5OB_06280 [Pirellula sp.]
MLALFSLLAVTYVVAASASRAGAQASRIRANQGNTSARNLSRDAIKQIVRGTRDQKSAAYKHALFEDIYDANAIRLQFGHRAYPQVSPAFRDSWCLRLTPIPTAQRPNPGVEIVKLSLDPRDPNQPNGGVGTYRLSPIENGYNARVFTVLEGPLAGQSFRILKYVGFVRSPADSVPDPNTPSNPAYVRNDAFDYDYSIAIDLSNVTGVLEGRWKNPSTNLVENFSGPLAAWINLPNNQGLRNLFYFYDPVSQAYQGYKCLINGPAFNNAGIGIEEVALDPNDNSGLTMNPSFGSLDSRRVMRIPTNPARKVSPALLPHYDYLDNPQIMASETGTGQIGVPEIGDLPRLRPSQNLLRGQSNEGYDVPDWRDFWLSHDTHVNINGSWVRNIIPSFHRPELINYIANLFGDPSVLSQGEVFELLQMIDASTARVMSYRFGRVVNPQFSPSSTYPKLPDGFTWSNPPTNAQVATLRAYVSSLINGPWDVDNDGDGVAEAVWVDFNLPSTHSFDGRMLKPLVAVTIADLDSRLNVNLHGDRVQGAGFNTIAGQDGFNAFTDSAGFLRNDLQGNSPTNVSQGMGFGPADISLNQLFGLNGNLLSSSINNFSLFDDRYGARRWRSPNVDLINSDRSPGLRGAGASFDGDDLLSMARDRETRYIDPAVNNQFVHGRMPGAPIGRRGAVAPAFDRNGNLAYIHPTVTDAYPDMGIVAGIPSERIGDAYETGSGQHAYADTPNPLAELEAILRRFDEDAASLPSHLRDRLRAAGISSGSEVNKLITTISGELRYPKLAAAAVSPTANGPVVLKDAGNLLGFMSLLHEQRYRKRSFPIPDPMQDEAQLSLEALYELFPPEFASNLRLDLNRPFGNGIDNQYTGPNGLETPNGEVDDPRELRFSPEKEVKLVVDANGNPNLQTSTISGYYNREQRTFNSVSRPFLGSRQLLARYLYCLGQLIIPRDYEFPSMANVNNALQRARLRARAIAQWAVNVVDFRDTDAAMTRFEYDIFPFGINDSGLGLNRTAYWAPDRLMVYNAMNNTYSPDNSQRQYIGVVWGMENPELLLTESLAFHDKRLRDTDMDGGSGKTTNDPMNPDPNMDQYRFPQGSLLLELYAPRTTYLPEDKRTAGAPSSLYRIQTNTPVRLDLGKLAPSSATWGAQPVWRIGINPIATGSTQQTNVIYQAAANDPKMDQTEVQFSRTSALSGDPTSSNPEVNLGAGLINDLVANSTTGAEFERIVWFTPQPPSNYPRVPNLQGNDANDLNPNRRHQVYYNRSNTVGDDVLMDGGSYLVVGPRRETVVGSLTNNPDTGAPWISRLQRSNLSTNRPVNSPSHQSITLDAGSVVTTLLNGEDVLRYRPEWKNAMKAPKGLICAADVPSESPLPPAGQRWGDCFENGIGLNISMPNPIAGQGYWTVNRKPLQRLNPDDKIAGRSDGRYGYGDTQLPPDSWVDCSGTGVGTFPDEPFDYDPTINPVLNPPSGPSMKDTGTYTNVRTAFLQRLADPNMEYDPINNPYITVDWLSIDLTVFNGEAPKADDPEDGGSGPIAFQSRYKDGADRQTASNKLNPATQGQPTNPGAKITQGGQQVWGYSYHSVSTAQLRATPAQTLNQPRPPRTGPQATRYPSYFMSQLGYSSPQPIDTGMTETDQQKHHSATTLGYVNVGYRFGSLIGTANDTADLFDGFGPPLAVTGNNFYNGAPRDLTSLVWLNRPFATPHELMLVPLTSPGQFGLKHSIANPATPRNPFQYLPSFQNTNALVTGLDEVNPSDLTDYPPTNSSPQQRNIVRMGGHWMRPAGSWQTSTAKSPVQADWSMLLEFVETQPPFVDASKFLNPEIVEEGALNSTVAGRFLASYLPANFTSNNEPDSQRGYSLLAPRNQIPNYVSAGKLNLNTITRQSTGRSEAFQGLEYLYLTRSQRTGAIQDTLTDRFFLTRQGFVGGTASTFFGNNVPANMDPNYPTQFAGAYRSALAANIAPYAPYLGQTQINNRPMVVQRGRYSNESTTLRSLNPDPTGRMQPNAANQGNLLFSPDGIAMNEVTLTPPPSPTTTEIEDAARNPFTRYQRAMRLPNLVTDQSNAFAVWVTVSLFEYDPIRGFGKEFTDGNGNNEREQSFFIIDRTVPVGFIPGEDLNTDKAILLERVISGGRR